MHIKFNSHDYEFVVGHSTTLLPKKDLAAMLEVNEYELWAAKDGMANLYTLKIMGS